MPAFSRPKYGNACTSIPFVKRADMPALYAAHDIFVFPSLAEGMPSDAAGSHGHRHAHHHQRRSGHGRSYRRRIQWATRAARPFDRASPTRSSGCAARRIYAGNWDKRRNKPRVTTLGRSSRKSLSVSCCLPPRVKERGIEIRGAQSTVRLGSEPAVFEQAASLPSSPGLCVVRIAPVCRAAYRCGTCRAATLGPAAARRWLKSG